MLRNRASVLLLQNFSRSFSYSRELHMRVPLAQDHFVMGSTNWRLKHSAKDNNVCIYRVPARLRNVDPGAYTPHFISVGPYHYDPHNFQESHKLKLLSLDCILGSAQQSWLESKQNLYDALYEIGDLARGYYSEGFNLSKDEFVEMMLLDGCFIIQLFKDLQKGDFARSSLLPKRWMLPVVRRDLITLENQLPMIVLKTIFDEMIKSSKPPLEELALRFFNPLMPREDEILKASVKAAIKEGQEIRYHHLLDLFHSSLYLEKAECYEGKVERAKEPNMYRSVSELSEHGVKFRLSSESQPLDVRFMNRKLMLPCLQIDGHTCSVLRNIVAYEQCHSHCKPDLTTYLFFITKLINTAADVEILHREKVIQHSLGSNQEVADLVNSVCRKVEHDVQNSYLWDVIGRINLKSESLWFRAKARLKYDYLYNNLGFAILMGLVVLYLDLVQVTCGLISAHSSRRQVSLLKEVDSSQKEADSSQTDVKWWSKFHEFLAHPYEFIKKNYGGDSNSPDNQHGNDHSAVLQESFLMTN